MAEKSKSPKWQQEMLRNITESQIREILWDAFAFVVVDEEGIIVCNNRPLEFLFGYIRNELLGVSLEALVPDEHQVGHPAWRQQYFQQPTIRPMNAGRPVTGIHKDGSHIQLLVSMYPFLLSHEQYALATVTGILAPTIVPTI